MNKIREKMRYLKKWTRSFFLYRLLLDKKFEYEHAPKLVDVRWKKVQTYGTFRCPIQLLRVSIPTKNGTVLMRIEQTPYYPYIKSLIKGDINQFAKQKLCQHIKNFQPNVKLEQSLGETVKLVKVLKTKKFDSTVSIVTNPPIYNRKYAAYEVRIYDGFRRACIAKSLGFKYITCRIK